MQKGILIASLFSLMLAAPCLAADSTDPGAQAAPAQENTTGDQTVPSVNPFDDGINAFNKGQFNEALGYFNAAVDAQPKNARAFYYRANTYLKLDRKKDALYDFNECIKLNNDKQVVQYAKVFADSLSEKAAATAAAPAQEAKETPFQRALRLQNLEQKYLHEAATSLDSKRKIAQQKITDIQRRRDKDIADVPLGVTQATGTLLVVANVDYGPTCQRIRDRADYEIKQIQQIIDADEERAKTEAHEKALAALADEDAKKAKGAQLAVGPKPTAAQSARAVTVQSNNPADGRH